MCGIAGFTIDRTTLSLEQREAVLDSMCRVMSHRGPDEQGMMISDRVALGMRRLSIIDLEGGHQPISGEDGNATLIFNGEIYNYRELQKELEGRGHKFQTHSDTEAIVHAYEEYGHACLEKLRGMFALAIWDHKADTLFIARDRAGKKPLYYTQTSFGGLVFGSELKVLLEHPEIRREIDPKAVDAYLTFGYVPDPMCIFAGIKKLAPGHFFTFKNGSLKVEQYWDFQFEPLKSERAEDYLEELRSLLEEAVRIRLVSDVPLGAFLSGGIDSSAVVGLMARASSRPVKTFSIGFKEDSYDELKYARIAARHFETDHHEFIVTPDICDIVDSLVWHFDEPFADSSAIPTYMVSKLAREYVTVALTGDGGDELFGGYTRYVVDSRRSGFARIPGVIRKSVIEPATRALPHGAHGRNFLYNIAQDQVDRYIDNVSIFSKLAKESLYTGEFRNQLDGFVADSVFQEHAQTMRTRAPLDTLLYLDSKTYLPGDILTKVDRMSMAWSLEARVPLLDHKLIEFVARIPASLKMRGGETKYIFRRVVEDLVPKENLNRPKQGFGLPIEQWIKQQLRGRIRETLMGKRTLERGYVRPEYVTVLLDEHDRGRRDHSTALWALMMLELWHRTFVDNPAPSLKETMNPEAAGVV